MALPPDTLDRWTAFCNNTEAWDKAWKILHSSIRMSGGVCPVWMADDVEFCWRYVLDARKLSWLLKWIKEIQGLRLALRQPGDRRVVLLRSAVRFFFAWRWIFENLHILTKVLPEGKGNFMQVKDPMVYNRAAKFSWELAILCSFASDLMVVAISKTPETAEEKRLRRLRAIQYFGDSLICANMCQVPQMVSRTLLGKQMVFYSSFVGLCGTVASILQCYFVFPARPALPAIKKD